MPWIDDLDVMRRLYVRSGNRTFAILSEHQGDFIAAVQAKHNALQVQHDMHHVFLNTIDRRILVQDASDRHLGRRVPNHRRQQHTPQSVAQCVTITALKGLKSDLGSVEPKGLHIDCFGLEQVRLHEVFLSIPSAHYADKAD